MHNIQIHDTQTKYGIYIYIYIYMYIYIYNVYIYIYAYKLYIYINCFHQKLSCQIDLIRLIQIKNRR